MKIEVVENIARTFGTDLEYPDVLIIKFWKWQIWFETDELYRLIQKQDGRE